MTSEAEPSTSRQKTTSTSGTGRNKRAGAVTSLSRRSHKVAKRRVVKHNVISQQPPALSDKAGSTTSSAGVGKITLPVAYPDAPPPTPNQSGSSSGFSSEAHV